MDAYHLPVPPLQQRGLREQCSGSLPSSATERRTSKYEGGQVAISWVEDRNNLRAGLYGFAQQDYQLFGLIYNDNSGPNLDPPDAEKPVGSWMAAYTEDQQKVTSWLTLNAGVRQTHFSGGLVENATSPRVGASVRIPKLNWVFRGFYGQFYQAPPLLTASGPLLQIGTSQNLGFVPLRGERDEKHQFGRDHSVSRLDPSLLSHKYMN